MMADVKPLPTPSLRRRNLPLLLLQARDSVIARFRPVLNAHGVTEQQWRVLRLLVDAGALEPRQIGRLCGISSPSLAGVLARMEEQGLVSRTAQAHDRRRQTVVTAPRGRRLAERMTPAIEAAYTEIEARLGVGFVRQLVEGLDTVIGALGPDPRGDGSGHGTAVGAGPRPARVPSDQGRHAGGAALDNG